MDIDFEDLFEEKILKRGYNLFATLKLYEKNYASKEETIKALKTYKLINQISFHTEKALSCIKYLGTEEVI